MSGADQPGAFRMRYGFPALLTGWLVTFLVFCLGLSVFSAIVTPPEGGFGWGLLPWALVFGFPIAVMVGLPLAVAVAWPLRRVRRQWLHVVAFALAVGAVMGVAGIFSYGAQMLWAAGLLAGGAAASAAIGRAVVIPLVARRN